MDDAAESALPTTQERLWTPWRMRYVGGGAAEPGCLFCNRLAADDDVRSLILHRGDMAFVIMNLFPYNTGHVMIVPNDHVASPETADESSLSSIGVLLRPTLRALRRALNADGFNVGINVGAVAGAGVADHFHQHVVPRWQGDANFMPILASTMVLPELIPVTYAKLRAELEREASGLAGTSFAIRLAILNQDASHVLVHDAKHEIALPTTSAEPGEAVSRAIGRFLTDEGIEAVLAGWAGPSRASRAQQPALTYLLSPSSLPKSTHRFMTVDVALTSLSREDDRSALRNAIAYLAPVDSSSTRPGPFGKTI
jgi:ATP adenylyltransferase